MFEICSTNVFLHALVIFDQDQVQKFALINHCVLLSKSGKIMGKIKKKLWALLFQQI